MSAAPLPPIDRPGLRTFVLDTSVLLSDPGALGRFAEHDVVLPLVAIATPIAVGIIFRAEAEAAFLMVATMVGIIMANVMNNGGGAWDNGKKFIEAGLLKDDDGAVQGKRSPAHAAAVVGDTVGDPFKDTAGPSLHVLIKLLSTITLVLAPLFIP